MNAAENVYENIFRWQEFFQQLVIPLQRDKSIQLNTRLIRSDADVYYPFTYHYENLDILLIEGILLFREKYIPCYDYKIWIECSFETGLQRAIHRNVEKLDELQLIFDYNTYYYPAQRLHIDRDNPRSSADIIFNNDKQPQLA